MSTLIPRALLFGPSSFESPVISPDGGSLAYFAPHDGVSTVWVWAMGAAQATPVPLAGRRPVHPSALLWTGDSQHVVFQRDDDGDELFHVFAYSVETGCVRDLTPHDGVRALPLRTSLARPHEVALSMSLRDPQWPDVHVVDVRTGARELLFDCVQVTPVLLDASFGIAVGVAGRQDGGKSIVVRREGEARWQVVTQLPVEEATTEMTSGCPVALAADGKGVLVSTAAGGRTARLVDLALESGEVRAVLAEDPRYDIGGVVAHPHTLAPLWAAVERDEPGHVAVDSAATAELDRLAYLVAGEPILHSQSADHSTWTVLVRRPDAVTEHWLHRVGSAPMRLPDSRPHLAPFDLSRRSSFRFTARDGLEMEGYITPPAQPVGDPPPAVLWVHGGPWGRDVGGFHPLAAFFADRGYVVVQVNYRGSTGYGVQLLEAGNKEWGRAMSHDLLDAVDHLAAMAVLDRRRVAIGGGSYGGYAALAGAAFTPDAYACAIDWVGPSSLVTLMEGVPPYWEVHRAVFARRMGDIATERDLLVERSPLTRAADIRIPILVLQGANDPRVPRRESDQLVDALKANGVEHQYVLLEDEGHSIGRPENMQRAMALMEAFLATHLGGRCEPV